MSLEKFKEFSSGLGSLGGLASSVIGAISSIGQTRRQKELMDYQANLNQKAFNYQQRAQEQMYARQLADQRQLIQEERDYNDYASVKARAQKAGINPLFALGGTGGIGIQSSSGNAPSLGAASANGVSIASPDSIGSNLIAAGSTLASISRQNALLDAELRNAEAEARIKEVKAFWADRNERADVEDKEWSAKLKEANVGATEANKRLINLKGDLAEQEKQFKESYNPAFLDQMQVSLDMSKEEFKHLQFKTATQEETYKLYVKTQEAHVYEVYESVKAKFAELELRGKELGLSEKQLDEVRAKRQQIERQFERTQNWKERMDKKNFTKDVTLGTINAFSGLLNSCSSAVNALGNAGLNLMTFGM